MKYLCENFISVVNPFVTEPRVLRLIVREILPTGWVGGWCDPFMNNCKLKLFILITKLKFSLQAATLLKSLFPKKQRKETRKVKVCIGEWCWFSRSGCWGGIGGVILTWGCCTTAQVERPCKIAAETFDCEFLGGRKSYVAYLLGREMQRILMRMRERESENFV